jgi:ribulose-phosphate 3-epimerase
MEYQIAPSILAANFARLGDEVSDVLTAGADLIHFDVMDNHYVPNLTVGPLVLDSLRKDLVSRDIDCVWDVHLMVKPVDRLIGDFLSAGANVISVHPESTEHLHRTLSLISEGGAKVGLALNPTTPTAIVDEVIDLIDMVLIMSVNPGFGGQAFIRSSLVKARQVADKIAACGRSIRVQMDGGISAANIAEVAAAGVDIFVAGSAIFGSDNYTTTISKMRQELE